ncbi:MAG: hypothetical protein AAGB02_02145 [Pseudomonadota bacterium]
MILTRALSIPIRIVIVLFAIAFPFSVNGVESGAMRYLASGEGKPASLQHQTMPVSPNGQKIIRIVRKKFQQAEFEDVISIVETADWAEEIPDDARALVLESRVRLRQYAELVQSLDSDPKKLAPWEQLALAKGFLGIGESLKASQMLDHVLRTEYAASDAWMLKARLALNTNQTSLARKALQRASENGLSASKLWSAKIEAAVRDGAFNEAESLLFSWSNDMDPSSRLDPHFLLARVFMNAARGQYEIAAKDLARIEKWISRSLIDPLILPLVYLRAGRTAQGIERIQDYLAEPVSDRERRVQTLIAAAGDANTISHLVDDQISGDLSAFLRFSIALDENDDDSAYNFLWSLLDFSSHDKSLEYVEHIFGKHSALADEVRVEVDKIRSYLESLAGVVKNTPQSQKENQPTLDNAIKALIAGERAIFDGRHAEAQKILEQILSSNPESLTAKELLAVVKINTAETDEIPAADQRISPSYSGLDRSRKLAMMHRDNEPRLIELARMLEADQKDFEGLILASEIFEYAGDERSTVRTLKSMLANHPQNFAAAAEYFLKMSRLGRTDEAVSFGEVVIQESSQADGARAMIGAYQNSQPQTPQVAPADPTRKKQSTQMRGLNCLDNRILAANLTLGFKSHPDLAAAVSRLAVYCAQSGNYSEANELVDIAKRAAPLAPEPWRAQFDIVLANGEFDIVAADRALRASRRAPLDTARLALASWHHEDSDRALGLTRETVWRAVPGSKVSISLAAAAGEHGFPHLAYAILEQVLMAPWLHQEHEQARKMLRDLNPIVAE